MASILEGGLIEELPKEITKSTNKPPTYYKKEKDKDLLNQIRLTEKWLSTATDPDHIKDLEEHLWRLNSRKTVKP